MNSLRSAACYNCCTESLSVKHPDDIEPVFIDCVDWLASVGDTMLSSAEISIRDMDSQETVNTGVIINGQMVLSENCEGEDKPLMVSEIKIERSVSQVHAKLSGGIPGNSYRIDVKVTSCQGYSKTHCVMQHIGDC